ESGRISASNPCSEYMSLDNSSCNLASINLLKCLRDDDTFDAARFRKETELIIPAMYSSLSFADFPTEKIAETTRAYRQLGIGYANLGALLMATGHAYDSEGGRAIAAAITSLMTGAAYKTSAELAAAVGPYDGYARNAKPHNRVIRKHADASEQIRPVGTIDREVLDLANATWRECADLGEANGYRNAQSSLLAPTGTIGLMMDCDTTGIEPDLALVKFKKLVGGGSMQIVNQTVPRALKNLGYPHEQVEAITEYIAEHGHVVNAPGLRTEHYEVFDCAMGERAISPMGHVRMMAAVQPYLSGAISKTVNMPESATVEDIENIYFEGWKLGLKALAISVGLQYGIPLDSYVAKFTNMRFEPAGLTDDPDIRLASSVMDYIFRRLALDHLPYEERAELGILSAAERAAEVAGHDPAGLAEEVDPTELAQSAAVEQPPAERSAVPAPAPPSNAR